MNNEGNIILSILIPSIPERKDKLLKLKDELKRQEIMMGDLDFFFETITNDSEPFLKGGLSIGKKRQSLVEAANGKYLCFLDDDESIAPNYLETLLRMCNYGQDVVTFQALAKLQTAWGIINMKLAYKINDQFTPEHTIRRPPWHICPVRSEFAKLYEFEDINNAEDFKWFEKVLTHCTTEAHTDKILFQYNHGTHSEADKITNHV